MPQRADVSSEAQDYLAVYLIATIGCLGAHRLTRAQACDIIRFLAESSHWFSLRGPAVCAIPVRDPENQQLPAGTGADTHPGLCASRAYPG